jgi:Na+/proline symporter
MSDIGLDWEPLDSAAIALILGAPGFIIGAVFGALAWRRRRFLGAVTGVLLGFVLWLGRFVLWKTSPWG